MKRALLAMLLVACHPTPSAPPYETASKAALADPVDAGRSDAAASPAALEAGVAEGPTQQDPDGDDDPEDMTGTLPEGGVFTKVGTPPLALTRICDLTPLGDALYAAHANQPLGTDGATITRYRPGDEKRPFTVAFDWNRPGEPTKGGGAGQGFTRVHAIGGRLFVPDSDPPYNGLGLVEWGTEGYVFVSDEHGVFAPPRAPHFRPPAAPDLTTTSGRAGAGVLPRAYHVLDAIRFRGGTFASTGSVPPTEKAWNGPSPGALHRADDAGAKWVYEVDYPFPYQNGVWRLTYMTRFRDRLFVGIQDYDGREPHDYLVLAPPREATRLAREHVEPVRITRTGAAQTLRWWVDTAVLPTRLYWVAWTRDTGAVLRVTSDGERWTPVVLPPDAGAPTDVKRIGRDVVVLAERGLYRLEGEGATPTQVAALDLPAPAPGKKPKPSPFELTDIFCAAPLAVFRGELYAGGQRGGTLWKVTAR